MPANKESVKMNKIVTSGLIIVIASALGVYCSTAAVQCGSSTDTFHIGMKIGSSGPDVRNWQCFLQAKGFGLTEDNSDHVRHDTAHHPYPRPDGKFDGETAEATMRFQASTSYSKHPIAVTGTVTFATYWKAVRAGMPKYPTVRPSNLGPLHFAAVAVNQFRVPMAQGCADSASPVWADVAYWQTYLVNMGYLPQTGFPTGTFGSTTQMATENFQSDYGVTGDVSGTVGTNTFNKAESNGMPTYTKVPGSTCN